MRLIDHFGMLKLTVLAYLSQNFRLLVNKARYIISNIYEYIPELFPHSSSKTVMGFSWLSLFIIELFIVTNSTYLIPFTFSDMDIGE